MVAFCQHAAGCSVYRRGGCTGTDCICVILGTDEADMMAELDGRGPEEWGP